MVPAQEGEASAARKTLNRFKKTWLARTFVVLAFASMTGLLLHCKNPLTSEEIEENNRFLIDLSNKAISPVLIQIMGEEGNGFQVVGLGSVTIQRTLAPGEEMTFRAGIVSSVTCIYFPPSDKAPRREVSWNGNSLSCHFWE